MRFNKNEKKFKYDEAAEQEDKKLRLEREAVNQRMARVCLEAMNSINKNLEFIVECQEDFPDQTLPTLDFKIWVDKTGKINHTYFQKNMKTPLIIMARSATPQQQKS